MACAIWRSIRTGAETLSVSDLQPTDFFSLRPESKNGGRIYNIYRVRTNRLTRWTAARIQKRRSGTVSLREADASSPCSTIVVRKTIVALPVDKFC